MCLILFIFSVCFTKADSPSLNIKLNPPEVSSKETVCKQLHLKFSNLSRNQRFRKTRK